MDPEQGLPVIVEDLAVKLFILFFRAVRRGLGPERMRIIDLDRTAADLETLLLRLCLYSLFALLLCGLSLFLRLDHLDDHIFRPALGLFDGLGHLGIMLGQIDLHGHKGAVFLNDFLRAVIIGKLHAVLGQVQSDCRADLLFVPAAHRIGAAAVALPVHRLSAFLPGQGIDLDQLRHHKGAVEAQAEMTDDLVVRRLVLVFFQKCLGAGESDIVNIFLDLLRSHAQTVVSDFDRLFPGVHFDIDAGLIAFRKFIVPHHIQLLELRDGITTVGDQLPVKNIMIRIQPLFDDRKHIFAVNG